MKKDDGDKEMDMRKAIKKSSKESSEIHQIHRKSIRFIGNPSDSSEIHRGKNRKIEKQR